MLEETLVMSANEIISEMTYLLYWCRHQTRKAGMDDTSSRDDEKKRQQYQKMEMNTEN